MKRKTLIVIFALILSALALVGAAWAADADRPRRRLQDQIVRGKVTGLDENTVWIETPGGNESSFAISERTVLWVPGEPPASTIELTVGDPVLAFGQSVPDETGSSVISARLVLVADEQEPPRVLIRGHALSVTRQTIVVQSGNRERAVTVLPRTRLRSTSGRLDSLRDIHPGDPLIALGQPTELGQWVAGLVMVAGPEVPARRGLRGTVVTLDAEEQTLTVQTEAGSQISVIAALIPRFAAPALREPSSRALP
jgi:RNase P/RNase MRP subunit p29